MARKRKIVYRGIKDSTCNGEVIVELAERKPVNYNYLEMSNKDIEHRSRCLDRDIARKRKMLGITEEYEPTYYWMMFGIEKVIDRASAILKIQNGIDVYTKDNEGNRHSVVFDGLKLITNN